MSLQKKIKDELDQLAIMIIRKAHYTQDARLRKMCEAWFNLKELLEKASEIESEHSSAYAELTEKCQESPKP